MRVGVRAAILGLGALCFLVACASPGAAADDLILRDFGGLKNLESGHGDPMLLWAERVFGPGDAYPVQTTYVDSARHIVVRANVHGFGDHTWLLHEFIGSFAARNRVGFDDEVALYGAGTTRRFEIHFTFPEKTTRLVSWPSGDKLVQIVFSLEASGRESDIPTEVLDAYLALYPSSLPASVEDTPAFHRQWVRDEMPRLLEYAARDLAFAREATAKGSQPGDSAFRVPPEQWRKGAVRQLERFAQLRAIAYGGGSAAELETGFQRAELAAATPQLSVDEAKMLPFVEQQRRELAGWWQSHRNDTPTVGDTGGPS